MSHEISHNGEHEPSQSTFDNTGKLAAILIGVIAAVAGLLMYWFNPFLNNAASVQGTYIDNLFGVATGIGTVVFVMVQGLLLYSIIRFHRQDGDDEDGPPIRGNTRLEIVWTVIPALVIIFLGILSYQVLVAAERPDPDELVVEVKGFQYAWQFYYPDYDITTTEMHLPVDRQARLKLRSTDVIHSFWVPEFRIKKDVMPDRVTETFITPIEEGVYPIVCAELCGAAHAAMRSQVVVESDSNFRQWVERPGRSRRPCGRGGRNRSHDQGPASVQSERVQRVPRAGRCGSGRAGWPGSRSDSARKPARWFRARRPGVHPRRDRGSQRIRGGRVSGQRHAGQLRHDDIRGRSECPG